MPTEMLDVKIIKIHRLAEGNNNTRAFVELAVNDSLLIKGIRVVHGERGLFVSMPAELGKDERWYERVRCLNRDVQAQITQKVLEAYNAPLQEE